MFTMGPYYPSLRINPADISKNFAGIIMALVNGIGALSYIPVPYITAVIAPDVRNFLYLVRWHAHIKCYITIKKIIKLKWH